MDEDVVISSLVLLGVGGIAAQTGNWYRGSAVEAAAANEDLVFPPVYVDDAAFCTRTSRLLIPPIKLCFVNWVEEIATDGKTMGGACWEDVRLKTIYLNCDLTFTA